MSKRCGKCEKTVYPTEELKCLDKVWHKMCFKCQVCNMTLNMKNYKGYNKLPYCNAHYPTTKATVVADTPEIRRIAANTQIQSQIKYHEAFEKEKGQKISVVDDPETQRAKKNMDVVSNIMYHGEHTRKDQMERSRPSEQEATGKQPTSYHPRRTPGSINDYDPTTGHPQQGGTPYSSRQQSTAVYDSRTGADRTSSGSRVSRQSTGSTSSYHEVPPPQHNVYTPPSPSYEDNAYRPPQQQQYSPVQPPQQQQHGRSSQSSPRYRAIYDYTAADADEISFQEGDIIVNTNIIDAGWMEGTNQRTTHHGMLPSNYVEKV